MNNSKIVLFLVFLITGFALNAQESYCIRESQNYIVDAGDASPDGSYAWTLEDEAGVDLSSLIDNNSTNEITIDWSDATLDTYSLPHTFTITVVETVNDCPGAPQELEITLAVGYTAPAITDPASPICSGDNDVAQEFLLTGGTPGATVGYTITSTGGYSNTNTITLDASGNESIPYPTLSDSNTSETFTLTLTSINDTTNTDCEELDLTADNITASVIINPIPVTSPIIEN